MKNNLRRKELRIIKSEFYNRKKNFYHCKLTCCAKCLSYFSRCSLDRWLLKHVCSREASKEKWREILFHKRLEHDALNLIIDVHETDFFPNFIARFVDVEILNWRFGSLRTISNLCIKWYSTKTPTLSLSLNFSIMIFREPQLVIIKLITPKWWTTFMKTTHARAKIIKVLMTTIVLIDISRENH